MYKNNLKEISNFSKKNNHFSDFNIVNNLLYNLNFTKYRSNNNNQFGGTTDPITGLPFDNPMDSFTNINPGLQSGLLGSVQQRSDTHNEDEILEVAQELSVDPTIVIETAKELETTVNSSNPNISVSQSIVQDQMGQMGQMGQIGQMMNQMGQMEIQPTLNLSYPDRYLQKPDFVTGEIKTYTIKKGTIMYHSVSNKRGFNTQNIQLGGDKIILFFTPNFRLASDKIEGCSIDKQKGYIHVFEVNQDIPNIYIKLPYDTDDDISMTSLHDQFCSGSKQYNGVGFFYPKNEIELFSNIMANPISQSGLSLNQGIAEENFYSEFGLCNPTPYLNYLYSQKCQSLRKLSQPYRIDS